MLKPALFNILLLLSFEATSGPKAIYGDDNRLDVFSVTDPLLLRMATPTAALIENSKLKTNGHLTTISARSLGEVYKLCPEERFRKQPAAAICSGTLVAPDLIMTAAHCYDLAKETCKNFSWVFDYKVSSAEQSSVTVSNSKVFTCKSIVLKKMNLKTGIDHALIQLNRPVLDREFAILSETEVRKGDPIVLIGHPSGLPTKIAGDAFALKILEHSFVSNVDAFSVNSGSGVFNAQTGEVIGILSAGQRDYDGKAECTSAVEYKMEEGNETVMKPDEIKTFLKRKNPTKNSEHHPRASVAPVGQQAPLSET